MKKGFKFNRTAWIGIVFLAAVVILLPSNTQLQDHRLEVQDLPPESDYQKEGHLKMDSYLFRLMKAYLTEGMEEAKEFARKRSIDMEGDLVRVVLEAELMGGSQEAGIAASLVSQQVEALGGRMETTYHNLVQSVVPFNALRDLADLPSVRYLRLPFKPVPLVVSQGVGVTGADKWYDTAPYRPGEDSKVCILDAGFKGYGALLGTELPSSVNVRSFRADGNISASKHGTACAEIVHDMAPNAQLWLANFNTSVEHRNAVNWIIDQGVNVISYSMGWYNISAGDGTGPICDDVKKAHDNNIIWISAAGNEAQDHYEGTYKDPDSDKRHNFSSTSEICDFWVPAWTPVAAFLNWDDWGIWDGVNYSGSDQDYDIILYIWTGSYWEYVDGSYNLQTGTQRPIEFIGYWYSNSSAYWGIQIRKYSATRNVKLELFTYGNSGSIEHNIPAGSLTIPADSQYAVAVGATDWSDDSYHSYSSRGPTSDGRVKPDFCAPSGVSGFTYGSSSFCGTSASTPHVAGAFGLLLDKTPFTLEQILAILEDRAKDLGASGKDNKFGIGRLNLSK